MYNSERLLLEFLLSAASEGAQIANYVEAGGFLQKDRQVTGVTARDLLTGQVFDMRAKLVINCAGAWVEGLLQEADVHTEYASSIAMNVIVDQLWSRIAAGLPSRPKAGRPPQILFFVPWRNKTMIGTWHIPWNDRPDAFKLSEAHLQGFIEEINSAHPPLQLTGDDIEHVTWGFLPVHSRDAGRQTVRLTRDGVVIDHYKSDGLAGLVSVIGVKYTTARAVAEQAVDLAMEKLDIKKVHCQTHVRRVHGGQIERFDALLKDALSKAPRVVNEEIIEHLVYTHGSNYQHIVKELVEIPEMGERVEIHLPVIRAEVLRAVRHEMALKLEDVIQRRTELGAAGVPSMRVLQKCTEIMSRELDWSLDRQQHEIESLLQKYPIRNTERVPV
jgi:glycerol-3-phosphate dehydrogenase